MVIIVGNDAEELPPNIPPDICSKIVGNIRRQRRKDTKVFDFVGIVTDSDGDMLVVLPKHCRKAIGDGLADARLLFRTMMRLNQRNIALAASGPIDMNTLESDYPFASFHVIYEYYRTYGLYHEDVPRTLPFPPGRANWKQTIANSTFYMINGHVFPFPLFYDHSARDQTFLTECMTYAINSTIERFGILLEGFSQIGADSGNRDLFADSTLVKRRLEALRGRTFRDSTLRLITSLIDFYSQVDNASGVFLRYSSFDHCWEMLVGSYLRRHFKGFDEGHRMILADAPGDVSFDTQTKVPRFNATNPSQFLQLDHYAYDSSQDAQYIIDEKYYRTMSELNYKQFAYTVLLKDHSVSGTGHVPGKTYSTMILPCENRQQRVHYVPSSVFSPVFKDSETKMTIMEEYLDTREVMEDFLA